MSSVPPSNQPGGGGYAPPPGGGYVTPPPAAAAGGSTNVMAIIGLVLGILSIVLFCVPPVAILFGIIAAVLGFIARGQIQQRGQSGQGLAIAAIVLGIIGILLGIVLFAGIFALGSVIPGLATQVSATLTAGP